MTAGIAVKAGRRGPLYLYTVEIIPADPGHAPYRVRRWAYSAEGAEDRVVSAPDWREEDRIGTVARVTT